MVTQCQPAPLQSSVQTDCRRCPDNKRKGAGYLEWRLYMQAPDKSNIRRPWCSLGEGSRVSKPPNLQNSLQTMSLYTRIGSNRGNPQSTIMYRKQNTPSLQTMLMQTAIISEIQARTQRGPVYEHHCAKQLLYAALESL